MSLVSKLLDTLSGGDQHLTDQTSDDSVLQRCKLLGSMIKSHRTPTWPSLPTPDLPPFDICDKLVACYLQTTETIFRVLHVPSFTKSYEAVKESAVISDPGFTVLLKLVMAIGAVTYDEEFSMRESAIRWVYEAQTWIAEPEFKSRLGLQFFQINILLLFGREIVAVGGHADSIWVSAGALLRRAMSMGLHRDPSRVHPKGTTFMAEMRRRLWNTIIELSLQSSLTSGGSPLISLVDFDSEPPGIFDDEHLLDDNPSPRLDSQFTDASVAVALRKTFSLRLEVTRFLNHIKSTGTYEETLKLDAELRKAFKVVYRSLHAFRSAAGRSPSPFATRAVDFIQSRYMSALHVPFFGPSFNGVAYAYSRKVVVDTSLKLWYATNWEPTTAIVESSRPADRTQSTDVDKTLARLISCGSGFYRTVAMQAALLLALELRAQAVESQSLGQTTLRNDLLQVLVDAMGWGLRCFDAGVTFVKGHLIICAVSAQIQGLKLGLCNDEIVGLIVQASEDSLQACLRILERKAAVESWEDLIRKDDRRDHDWQAMEDWDLLVCIDLGTRITLRWLIKELKMSNPLFNTGGTEPIAWMLDDEEVRGPALC